MVKKQAQYTMIYDYLENYIKKTWFEIQMGAGWEDEQNSQLEEMKKINNEIEKDHKEQQEKLGKILAESELQDKGSELEDSEDCEDRDEEQKIEDDSP